MNAEKYKHVTAELMVEGEEHVIEDWGVNVEINEDHIIFDQIIRQSVYKKHLVTVLKLNAWK